MTVERVIVTGGYGQLGSELTRAFVAVGAQVVPLGRPEFRLEASSFVDVMGRHQPTVIVNAAAWTDVDACARDPERALELNGRAVGRLAAAADALSAQMVQVSTNEVFEGAPGHSYRESDVARPINPYGESKLAGEKAALDAASSCTVVRTAWIFGGPRSFPTKILAMAAQVADRNETLRVVEDEIGNPTPAATLADRIVRLTRLASPPSIIHLAGEPSASRLEWAKQILLDAGVRVAIAPISAREYRRDSTPPPHAVLDTTLSRQLGLGIGWRPAP